MRIIGLVGVVMWLWGATPDQIMKGVLLTVAIVAVGLLQLLTK